jgi:hypothetical protein
MNSIKYKYNRIAKLLLLVLIIGFSSCRKIESYPPEPEIEFVSGSFAIFEDELNNKILVYHSKISFTDGDGNIGWEKSNERPPGVKRPCDVSNPHDLYVDLYEEINGVFVKRNFRVDYQCIDDTLKNLGQNSIDANLPYMDGRGQANVLVGDIEYKIELPSLRSSTIKFEIKLTDRENNESNIVESPIYDGVESPK